MTMLDKRSAAGKATGPQVIAAVVIGLLVGWSPSLGAIADNATASGKDEAVAASLAEMLRDARTIISNNEDLINDPTLGDKHLTGTKVKAEAIELYRKNTGVDPNSFDKDTRQGRLLRAMMNAIVQVVDENQATINEKGTGFKGFIPAVFGRLVSETFNGLAENEAVIKVTAPPELVRNRKARPDAWEKEVIESKLLRPDWPKGQPFAANVSINNRAAYRVAVPEYYTESCLTCHGRPKGELDITGYPKEGRKLGDLGAVISITLLR
jgi:uncharacterized protein DUF3365